MRENRIHNLPYEKVEKNEPVCIADEVPFEIPNTWEWIRLGELFQHNTGKALNTSNRTGKLLTYITTSNLYWDRFELDNVREMYFTDTEIDKCTVCKGDLLVCEGGDIGRAAIWNYDDDIRIQNHIHRLRAYSKVCTEYYYYLFFLYKHAGWIGGKGIGIQGLSANALHSLIFPLPPYEEQIRIVNRIKDIEPFLEKYGANEQKLDTLNKSFPEQLKKSILQEAVQGKLVPQNLNDEPASVLLERIRAEKEALIKAGKIKRDKKESVIFRRDNSHYEKRGSEEICIDDDIPFDCPQSWAWCRMGDLISVRGGKRLPAGAQLTTKKTDHVYIRVTDMKNGTVDLSDLHYISDDIYDSIKNYIIRSEDVYIVIVGSTIGKAGIVPYELDGMNLTENAARLTPILVNRDYLLLAIQTDLLQKQFIDRTNQVGQPKLALERLKTALIPLPPLNEQQRIIETYRTLVPIIQNA